MSDATASPLKVPSDCPRRLEHPARDRLDTVARFFERQMAVCEIPMSRLETIIRHGTAYMKQDAMRLLVATYW